MKTTTLVTLGALAALALLSPLASATPTCEHPSVEYEPLVDVDNTTCVDPEGDYLVYGGTRGHVGPKPVYNQYWVNP